MSENAEMKNVPLEVPFAAEETKPYIFISYAHGDRERVFPIIKEIYEKGWHVWYDQGIEINKNYHNVIADHVLGCEVVVLFVSKTSVTREYVTDTEIAFALDEKKRIIFCELEEAELPSGIRSRTTDRERFPRTTVEGLCGVLEGIEGLTRVPEREAQGIRINVRNEGELILSNPEDEYEAEVTTENCIRLTKYKGNDENVVVPAKWKGLPVVELEKTFRGNQTIKSVTIADSVTAIGNWVFDGCSGLSSVNIPYGVIDIGLRAFADCSKLISVTLPNSVTNINRSAFLGCTQLATIVIPDSVTSIGGWAFSKCKKLSITCGENSYAHQYAEKNELSVSIVEFDNTQMPASSNIPFKSDEEEPFVYCSYAHENRDIVYPIMKRLHDDGFSIRYDELDRNSFACAKDINACEFFLAFLTPEYLSGTVEELRLAVPEKRILYWLERCNLPEDLQLQQGSVQGLCSWERTQENIIASIETMLINGKCRGHYIPTIPDFEYKADNAGITLTSYTGNDRNVAIAPEYFGRPVIHIGSSAFGKCKNLTSVIIPNGVISIGNKAFSGCRHLISITIPDSVTTIGDFAFSRCSKLSSIAIPKTVTNIGNSAFSECSSLTSIAIPECVTTIGNGAFSECSSLTSIAIPECVTTIGNGAFYGCSSLTSITIPESVTTIENFAFSECNGLTSIAIPESVTSIGDRTFFDCCNLSAINVVESNKTYKSIDGVLFSHDGQQLLAFPGGKRGDYSIPDSVTSIADGAFSNCSGLSSVIIPDGVTDIGRDTFYSCSGLASITIPKNVISIGNSAFSGCSNLTSVTVPDSVTKIGKQVFDDCPNLTVSCPENSCAWQYCEENNIPHKPLEDATAAESDTVSAPLAEVPAAEPEIIADAATAEATPEPAPTPTKSKTRRWLLPLILALALLAGGAAVQFTGLFDILGWLSGLLG